MDSNQIRELFKTHDVAIGRKDVWDVNGKPVILHAALERLAAGMKLTWDAPNIVTAQSDEVVLWCRATRKDGISEWSFGEVKIVKEGVVGGNYKVTGKQPGYPYAMAEKRAKDRVIIKLAGLHGAYSDEEADDFKDRRSDAEVERDEPKVETVKTQIAKAEASLESKAEADGAKVIEAEASAAKGGKAKVQYTDEQRTDMLLENLAKNGTTIGRVTAWMTSKANQERLKALPSEMAKRVSDEAKRLQEKFQDDAAANAQSPRSSEGRMDDVPASH